MNKSHRLLPSRRFAFIMLSMAVLFTAPFFYTQLDLIVTQQFYHEISINSFWPMKEKYWVIFFYRSAPILTIAITASSLVLLVYAFIKNNRRLRNICLFLLLTFIIAPGLITNALFKDNWGRPRPRQIVEFGGEQVYVPPLKYHGHQFNGHSFPSGHSAVGFALFSLWLIGRKKGKLSSFSLMLFFLVMSLGLMWTRIVSGGHFLSDTLWSGLISVSVSWWLYHYLFRLDKNE